MNIQKISLNGKCDDDNMLICKIELTLKETEAIIHSLCRTSCRGEQLTISMELEDKLKNVLTYYRYQLN
jgi:hypothetical protein